LRPSSPTPAATLLERGESRTVVTHRRVTGDPESPADLDRARRGVRTMSRSLGSFASMRPRRRPSMASAARPSTSFPSNGGRNLDRALCPSCRAGGAIRVEGPIRVQSGGWRRADNGSQNRFNFALPSLSGTSPGVLTRSIPANFAFHFNAGSCSSRVRQGRFGRRTTSEASDRSVCPTL
jgi:hypothetical protein